MKENLVSQVFEILSRAMPLKVLGLFLVIAFVGSLGSPYLALAESKHPSDNIVWLTYNDPRFSFSISYPSDWTIQPRTDSQDAISEVLMFLSPTSREDGAPHSIAIGQYLVEIKSGDSLTDWTDTYPSEFSSSEIKTTAKRSLKVNGLTARYVRGVSPITEYQYTNIRRGRVVWFVWANFGDSADRSLNEVYESMVNSMRFGSKAPQTLQDIYGRSFQANDLETALNLRGHSRRNPGLAALFTRLSTIGSDWWAPLLGSFSVTCGSPYHTNGALYAADAGAPYGRSIYAAYGGTVEKAGWDTSGYGNLVKLKAGNGYRHLYGHLAMIYGPIYTIGSWVSQTDFIGTVGNSGGVPTHLHFHIQSGQYQDSSSGITLVGMTGFTDNASDPYYPSNDGVDHPNCATIGR